MTFPDKVLEDFQAGLIGGEDLSPEQLRAVIAIGGARRTFVLPAPIVEQLNAMEKPKPGGAIDRASRELTKAWKIWTLLNPKRALAYNLRNMTGDIDPVMGAAPEVVARVPRASKELWKYHRGELALTPDLRRAIDLGVVSASMTATEIPDLKDLSLFRRFYEGRKNPGMVQQYLDVVRRFTEFRENLLRYAAYLHYKEALAKGPLTHYGGANPRTVENLKGQMGLDVAAAHMSRNLLGDYGNISVFGDWMRTHAYPFWSWIEINSRRYGQMTLNAWNAGKMRQMGALIRPAYVALAFLKMGTLYALIQLWNNLVHPDTEDELSTYDRANPHIDLGHTKDGSAVIFRNVGALGDVGEWFGINDLIALYPLWANKQMTGADVLKEMAKAPVNKLAQGSMPVLKSLTEAATGYSAFPDVFNPRGVERSEALAGLFGLQDEQRWLRGVLFGEGVRARPHYLMRWGLGVVDPRKNALYEMYDLRERYLKQAGKPRPPFRTTFTPFRNMRYAAMSEDYGAFKEAYDQYVKEGKTVKNFKSALAYLDPISQHLGARDEAAFEEFLSAVQRRKLRVARDYADALRARLWAFWDRAEAEGTPEKKP